jgi:hypothetical protein
MKYTRSKRRLQWLARVLVLALVVTQWTWGPPPAQAQRTIPSVLVLDFNNCTTVGGALLGRIAAAQVSLQLSESQNWDVIPEAQVQQRVQQLNLQPPFDRIARVQIASGVDASAVVFGKIMEARVSTQPVPQAFVRLQVLVEDINTSVLINGAVAEGLSTPRMGYTGDADILLEEALGKAAFRAREFMDRFRLPEGTVLNTTVVGTVERPELDALLNAGARQGVRRGMEMIVTRQRDTVGRLKVTSVDADISTARVIENIQGVRPEDRVRAIFNFSDFPITRTRIRAAAQSPQVRTAALPGKGAGETDAAVPGRKPGSSESPVRVASAGKGAEFVPFRARQDAHLRVAEATVQPPPPVVVDEPQLDCEEEGPGRGSRRIIGAKTLAMLVGGLLFLGVLAIGGRGGRNADRPFEIRAFGTQREIGEPGATIRVTWDRPKTIRNSQILQYIIWRFENVGLSPQIVGALDTDTLRGFADNEQIRSVIAFNGDPGTDDVGVRATIANVPGIVPGNEYRYQIATAYTNGLEDRDNDGMPDVGDFMSPLSLTSTWATAIRPARIISPLQGTEVDLTQLEITWEQTPGADEYILWISTDPRFRRGVTVRGPFQESPVNLGGPLTITQTIDVSGLGASQRIFVTVGARNSQDPIPPKPLGWIFSQPLQVRSLITPPEPPNGGTPPDGGGPPAPPASASNGKEKKKDNPRGGRQGGGRRNR